MSDEGDPKKDYERMSLGSLKRELEVQKAQTEMAREESKARLAANEQKARAFPWGMVLGIVVLGLGGFFGLVYALRESFPAVAQTVMPFMYVPPPDAGVPLRPDAWIAPHDAGTDAHHVAHHPHPPTSGTGSGSDLSGLGDLGGSGNDPLEGMGGGGR